MEHKLFASMGFSVCALIFLLFILMMYLSKRRTRSIGDKTFYFLLRLNIVMTFTEFIYIILMSKVDQFPVLCEVFCRLYILEGSTWLITFFYYIWSLSQSQVKDEEQILKKTKTVFSLLTLLLVAANVMSLSFPLEYIHPKNDFYVFGGKPVISIYILGLIVGIIIFASFIIQRDHFTKRQVRPIYFSYGIIIVLFAFQLITGYDFNILTFIYALILSTLFFTVESQDYKLIEELEEKKHQAELADKATTRFLSSMSHAIRTPMTTILGFSDLLLKEEKLSENQVEADAKDIHEAGTELLELINNILDVSRIESGKEEIEEKEYLLETLVYEVGSVVRSKVKEDVLEYQVHIDEKLPSKLYGDYVKVYKILVAVILNAIHYTHYGNVNLDISGNQVEDNQLELELKVSNSGHEMKKELFERDFNDYVELEEDNHTDEVVNLHIVVVKKLVEMLGGTIEFVNETGKGTQYTIRLTQKVVDSKPIGNIFENMDVHHTHTKGPDLSSKHFLIVDDNRVNLKITSRLLQRYHADVSVANSGKECMELVKDNHYDMIFLDHMMPDMDGMTTMKLLKGSGHDIPPVIALTANTSSGLREKYVQAGFSDYLSKPINNGDLNRLMVKYFVEKE